MITLSPRYAYVLAVALFLVSIPIWYHAVESPRVFSCSDPDTLLRSKSLPQVATFTPLPFKRHEFFDGAAGTLSLPGRWKADPKWRVTRTFELRRYYYHPPASFTNLLPDDELELRPVMVDGVELPIHLRWDESQGLAVMIAYLYILDGRPIGNPFTGSAAAAIAQLKSGRFPLTEILVSGISPFTNEDANRQALVDWIQSAWVRYDEVCNP